MRLIGLLSWYNEPVDNLVSCLAGLKRAGVDHVVALDGAYALFPEGTASSSHEEHMALFGGCRYLEMGLTVSTPQTPWQGNECEKRTRLFELGLAEAAPGDWFFVMDADQIVTRVPDDFRARLENTELEVAETEFLDVVAQVAQQKDWPERFALRNLFKAQRITVERHHFTYVTDDGRLLCGYDALHHDNELEPCLDLTDVEVEHRPNDRPHDRLMAKLTYYRERDRAQIERGICDCGAPSVKLVAREWRMTEIGPVATWFESCEECAVKREARSRYELVMLGIDPDTVVVEPRPGRPPDPVPS